MTAVVRSLALAALLGSILRAQTPAVLVRGRVVSDASNEPVRNARVGFVESRFVGHAVAASDGAFDLHPLPPGTYYVAALELQDDFERHRPFEDPAFLESLAAGATKVTLAEGETRTVSLGVVAR